MCLPFWKTTPKKPYLSSSKSYPLETYSLYELNEHIRRVLSLNFQEAVWIRAEVSRASFSRGHCYLELVEKAGEEGDLDIQAKASAIVWRNTLSRWERQHNLPPSFIQEDTELRIQVRVDFHEQFGLKLLVQDIDPAFTLGRLAMQRREVLKQLEKMQLLDRNRRLPLPSVIQQVAVISSPRAAGLQDFLAHLQQNDWGYRFQLELFPAAMQGRQVGPEVSARLQEIALRAAEFDGIALLRGGGARLDLLAFDQLELCEAVAQAPLPVWTGIGHDIDEAVIDRVAHKALKTPTAVADYLLHHNARFENRLLQTGEALVRQLQLRLEAERLRLGKRSQEAQSVVQHALEKRRQHLRELRRNLRSTLYLQRDRQQQKLNLLEKQMGLLDPDAILARGFSLTTWGDKPLRAQDMPPPGALIHTHIQGGKIDSRVEKVNANETE